MLNRAIRVCHRLRFCLRARWAGRLQRRNRVLLSHIRTPFGRTFIAHPAYREKQGKSVILAEGLVMLDVKLGLDVDTGGLDFVPGCAKQPAIELH